MQDKISVSRTCTNPSMNADARRIVTLSRHTHSGVGFLNALRRCVAEYDLAIAAYGNRAGVSVWAQVGSFRVSAQTAKFTLQIICHEVADSRADREVADRSERQVAERYFHTAITGGLSHDQ
mgnify:CR=1 FL=1